MNKLKILHLITGLERGGGAENMFLNLIPKLDGCHAVCVLKKGGEISEKLEQQNIKVYSLNMKIYNPVFVLRYLNVVRDFKPDIQINYLIHADILGRVLGKIFCVPKIISYIRNRHEEKLFFWLDHLTLFLVDSVLVNSEPLLYFYMKKHNVKKDNIDFIPNAVDLKNITKLSKEEINFNFDKNKKYIISTARLHSQKDILTLIRAFKLVQNDRNDCDLIIANDGPEKKKIQDLVESLDVSLKVHFIGKKSNIYPYILNSDLFVLSSKFEGMSNALLEALALKKPVIVSNIPENTQIICNNEHVFSTGNHLELSEKLSTILYKNNDSVVKLNYYLIKKYYNLDLICGKINKFLINVESNEK